MTRGASWPWVWIARSTDIISVNFEHILIPQYSCQLQIDSGSPVKINWISPYLAIVEGVADAATLPLLAMFNE